MNILRSLAIPCVKVLSICLMLTALLFIGTLPGLLDCSLDHRLALLFIFGSVFVHYLILDLHFFTLFAAIKNDFASGSFLYI